MTKEGRKENWGGLEYHKDLAGSESSDRSKLKNKNVKGQMLESQQVFHCTDGMDRVGERGL